MTLPPGLMIEKSGGVVVVVGVVKSSEEVKPGGGTQGAERERAGCILHMDRIEAITSWKLMSL
jgi:hypothetical protein